MMDRRSLILTSFLLFFLFLSLVCLIIYDELNYQKLNPETSTITTTTSTEVVKLAPNDYDGLLKDIVVDAVKYESDSELIILINQQYVKDIITSLKQIDLKILKAFWYSESKIVLTNYPLTDLPALEFLKGLKSCNDPVASCRKYEEIKGLQFGNAAYLWINDCVSDGYFFDQIRADNYCNMKQKINGELVTLFHEAGHLVDQTKALRAQFLTDPSLLGLSYADEYDAIHQEEYPLFLKKLGNGKYFSTPLEYFAEVFAIYHGHRLDVNNPLQELMNKTPKTYNYLREIINNYNPVPIKLDYES